MLVLIVFITLEFLVYVFFFFQAEDGIRDLVRSRGLGDVYKRQVVEFATVVESTSPGEDRGDRVGRRRLALLVLPIVCLLYTSDAADERSSVDLGGRRIIKKKKDTARMRERYSNYKKHTMITESKT